MKQTKHQSYKVTKKKKKKTTTRDPGFDIRAGAFSFSLYYLPTAKQIKSKVFSYFFIQTYLW